MTENYSTLPTLQQIREAHGWKRDYEKYLPLSRFIFRPLGFLLTWVAIRTGWTTESVAWLSGIVGIVGCLCLMSKWPQLLPLGIGLLLFFNLLDCVDGSIARTMKTENPYGRFLDSVCGGVIDLAFWGVIGILAYQHPHYLHWGNPFHIGYTFWLAVGAFTCFLFIFSAYVERIFDYVLRPDWERIKTDTASSRPPTAIGEREKQKRKWKKNEIMTLVRKINNNLRVRETHYVFLIITIWLRKLDFLIIFYLFYYLLNAAILMLVYCFRGSKVKDTFKRCQHPGFRESP